MSLSDKVFNLNSFKKQYDAVLSISVCETIPNLEWNEDKASLLRKIDWNNVVSIACILSYSERSAHLDAALRIAHTCITQETTSKEQKYAAALILSNLTNEPAIDLAIKRELLDRNFKKELPFSIKLQTYQTEIENSIIVNGKLIHLNKFQRSVYNCFENSDTISISAPTSAGKSYILCTIILEELLQKISNIVYIVPTRALISQVENDLRELIKINNMPEVNISTVPQQENISGGSNIFVFTQERLHWFLISNSNITIDTVIIDEAHKIGDNNRGILLQQKIEELVNNYPYIRIYFSSPFTSNPEILFENINSLGSKEKINTQFVSVNQNLIYIKQIPRKSDEWQLSLCLIDKNIDLGTVKLKDRIDTELKKLAFLVESVSADNLSNIIYANGAAEAEKYSLILYDLLKETNISDRISELIKLIKKTIHKEYLLCKVLQKGIAFHYGNMPLLIRQEIERLFKSGDIKYLICTSTLLEGVNLPAKSIFIKNPTRGRNHPLDQNDFWNLAGRAGRWGKEFCGNIFCIEPHKWKIRPNPNKLQHKIVRALDKIELNKEELIVYIKDKSPRIVAEKRQDLEYAFGYYYIKYINQELSEDNDFHNLLLSLFEDIKSQILLPDYIIKRNPGISPLAQQTLLSFFMNNANKIEEMVPVYPEDTNAFAEYTNLINRIGNTLSFYQPKLDKSRAILLINWMSGKPLSYLINSSWTSYKSNPHYSNKKLPGVIREVMDNIENFVRFRFAKDSSCYIDVLRYFLEIQQREDLINIIPQLNLWLEFGVSQKTHLSLLSLGLSRNTVIELSGYITNSQMTREECIKWIKEQNFTHFNFSPIIIEDIMRVL